KRNNPERSLFINFLRGSWPSCKLNGRFSILWKYRMKEFTDNVYSLFPILIGLWQGIVARIEEVVADKAEMVECFYHEKKKKKTPNPHTTSATGLFITSRSNNAEASRSGSAKRRPKTGRPKKSPVSVVHLIHIPT